MCEEELEDCDELPDDCELLEVWTEAEPPPEDPLLETVTLAGEEPVVAPATAEVTLPLPALPFDPLSPLGPDVVTETDVDPGEFVAGAGELGVVTLAIAGGGAGAKPLPVDETALVEPERAPVEPEPPPSSCHFLLLPGDASFEDGAATLGATSGASDGEAVVDALSTTALVLAELVSGAVPPFGAGEGGASGGVLGALGGGEGGEDGAGEDGGADGAAGVACTAWSLPLPFTVTSRLTGCPTRTCRTSDGSACTATPLTCRVVPLVMPSSKPSKRTARTALCSSERSLG